jgi:hypothetical protein
VEFRELESVVLPASLGRSRTDGIADNFVRWFRDYKPGAEVSSGYGFPRTQLIGPNPSTHYAAQLTDLDLTRLDASAKRAAVEKALEAAKIDRIPPTPQRQTRRRRSAGIFLQLGRWRGFSLRRCHQARRLPRARRFGQAAAEVDLDASPRKRHLRHRSRNFRGNAGQKLSELYLRASITIVEAGRSLFDFENRSQYRERMAKYGENPWRGDFIEGQAAAGGISRTWPSAVKPSTGRLAPRVGAARKILL